MTFVFCNFGNTSGTPETIGTLRIVYGDNITGRRYRIIPSGRMGYSLQEQQRNMGIPKDYKVLTKAGTTINIKFHKEERTWQEAFTVCQSEGGALVKLDTQPRLDLLAKIQSPFDSMNHST